MNKLISELDLECLVINAKQYFSSWGSESNVEASHITAYFAELTGQIPGLILLGEFVDKQRIIENTYFYSSVLGRVAQLEGVDFKPTHQSRFNTESGVNQVDQFLIQVGYLKI